MGRLVVWGIVVLTLVAIAEPGAGAAVELACKTVPDPEDHAPIELTADAAFAFPDLGGIGNGVRSGSGTLSDPYVISDWEIVQQDRAAIALKDTRAHVLLRDIVVRGTFSQLWSPIVLSNVQNVTLEDVFVLAPSDAVLPSVAMGRATQVSVRDIQFGSKEGADVPPQAMTLRQVQVEMDGVVLCGDGDLLVGTQGENHGTDLVMRNVAAFGGERPHRLSVLAETFTLEKASGPIRVSASLDPGGTAHIADSRLRSVAASTREEGSPVDLTMRDTSLSCSSGCATYLGISAGLGPGHLEVRGLNIEQWEKMMLVRSGSASITDSSLRYEVGEDTVAADTAAIEIQPHCDGTCGRFEFDGNDLVFSNTQDDRIGIRFLSKGPSLTGTGNFLQNAAVEGPVRLTEPAASPHFGDANSETASSGGVLPVLLLLLASLVYAHRPRTD